MTSINTTTKDLPTWHLNLTVTMADVWGIKPEPNPKPEPKPKPVEVRKPAPRRAPIQQQQQPRPARKIPFVGKEGSLKFRLVSESGAFLHVSGYALTDNKAYAWEGSEHHFRKLRSVSPIAAACKPVEVFQ